ncbi:MAG: serine/threonine protein kinase [Lachnospiraceae bacterium]
MDISDTILFGKYRLCRMIGRGRTGTVYLAKHESLGEYRAIKEVPKSDACYEQFLREARIMKELHHPSIPIIYDLEETDTHCYLIEEFLEGESLMTLVQRWSYLSRSMVIRYGIQICSLVQYLHSAGRDPILHLDLQPNNLLLCHDVIKLVDFGNADYLTQANETNIRCGTPGCAAPEQYTKEPLDERTDIYAIGVLLFYLATGQLPERLGQENRTDWDMALGRELGTLVRDCLQIREKRLKTALEVKLRLEALMETEPRPIQENSDVARIVSIVGSVPNIGVTHLALGLSSCLWRWGISNLYEERNLSGHGIILAEYAHADPDSSGICQVGSWRLLPHYGPQVRLKEAGEFQVYIRDYGTDWTAAVRDHEKTDFLKKSLVCVCGGKPYNQIENSRAVRKLGGNQTVLIFNFLEPGFLPSCPQKGLERETLFMPYFPKTERPDEDAESFYRELWDRLTEKKGDGKTTVFLRIKNLLKWKKKL